MGTEREWVEVQKASEAPPTKRGKYKAWTTKDLAEIGKYVNDHGNAATIHHFPTRHPVLKRQTVDNFKRLYQKAKQKSHNKELRIVFMNLTLHFFSKMHTCRLLRLNLGVQEEHLTSQLSWVIISRTCLPCPPSRWVLSPCILYPLTIGLKVVLSTFFMHGEYGFSPMGSWCYSREWV